MFSTSFQESGKLQDGRSKYLLDYVQSLKGDAYENTLLGGGYDDVVKTILGDGRVYGDALSAAEEEVQEGNPVVDIRMGVVGQNQDIGIALDTILSDGKLVSDMVDCDVQQALDTILWPILGNWTLTSSREISTKELVDLGRDMCKVEVPVAVLKDYTLMQIVVVRESSSLSDSFGGLLDALGDDALRQISNIMKFNATMDVRVEKIAALLGVAPSTLKASLEREFAHPQENLKNSEQEQEFNLVMLTRHSQHLLQMEVDTIKAACPQVLGNERWRDEIIRVQHKIAAHTVRVNGMQSESDFAADEDMNDGDINKPPKVNRVCVDYHPCVNIGPIRENALPT